LKQDLEFLAVGGIFEALANALEVAAHSDEGIARGQKESCTGRNGKDKGESIFHGSKVKPVLLGDKSIFSRLGIQAGLS